MRTCLVDLEPGATVVVACSGGADSTALLAATVFEARRAGWRVVGATVDHGLQPGSAEVAELVVARMAALGADETLTARVTVDGGGLGPEAAARRARYAVLEQVREHVGADVVLLGHTRDDQAETVLLGLARGSGGRSLAGMRRRFDHFRRPLLDLSRDDTVTACQVEGLDVWEDPHNADPGYTRVRVRRTVLPLLETELGPGVAETLARTARQVQDDLDALDELVDARTLGIAPLEGVDPGDGLDVGRLATLPRAVRTRLLRAWALRCGAAEVTAEHVARLEALVTDWHGQGRVDLPGGVGVRRASGRLVPESPTLWSSE